MSSTPCSEQDPARPKNTGSISLRSSILARRRAPSLSGRNGRTSPTGSAFRTSATSPVESAILDMAPAAPSQTRNASSMAFRIGESRDGRETIPGPVREFARTIFEGGERELTFGFAQCEDLGAFDISSPKNMCKMTEVNSKNRYVQIYSIWCQAGRGLKVAGQERGRPRGVPAARFWRSEPVRWGPGRTHRSRRSPDS